MTIQATKKILTYFLLFFSTYVFSQEGTLSGVLKGNDGVPMPGVSIIIKGTTTGVLTNFDGEYNVKCRVGDVLVFSYIGMKTREVKITASLLDINNNAGIIEHEAVKNIKSDAYKNAINSIDKFNNSIPNIENSAHTYNKKSDLKFNQIKNINITDEHVNLSYYNSDVFFEIGYKTINGYRFVKNSNIPDLQTIYSQGLSQNGNLTFQGPETDNVFSYGPELSTLEFDGLNYQYDTQGRLVPLGTGNGNQPKIYRNSFFESSIQSLHNVFFNITTNNTLLGLDFTNKTQKDLYNFEKNNSNSLTINFEKPLKDQQNVGWDAFIKYSSQNNNQPNLNGFQNNLLLNAWVTPVSFSNKQNTESLNGLQRSFSPNRYNNPEWLLRNNRNSENTTRFISSLQNKFKITDYMAVSSKLSYSRYKNNQNFGLPTQTVGFEEGYLSRRNIDKNNFNAVLNFNYNTHKNNSKIDIVSLANYTYEDLKYTLNQATNFNDFSFTNAQNTTQKKRNISRNTLRLSNKINYNWNDNAFKVSIINNSYLSSIQDNKWLLPTFQFKINLDKFIRDYKFYKFSISANTAFDVNDAPLLYNNQSHNSLNIQPSQSLGYLAVNDLFVNKSLKLEDKQSYNLNLNLGFRLFNTSFDFGITHFNSIVKNALFPIFNNNAFQLKNIANTQNKGFELEFSTRIGRYNKLHYQPTITFSTYRTKVLKLLEDEKKIPIAGFSTVSKNLIVGQPAGVIVGSVYARDSNNNIVIDDNGFPIVSPTSQIIGDPTPQYNVGFNNAFKWKNFNFNILLDIQKGGDVWNGTQNVLNYFGTSQQSALERTTTNFVFNGVNQQGDVNTIPVDFYNPSNSISENKFVRHGFSGIAENAIEDGSYINLKSINIAYTIKKNAENQFIRYLDIGLYGNNLITWSKFKGASPYSSLYNNDTSSGLNFFNTPLISEVGLKINIKI